MMRFVATAVLALLLSIGAAAEEPVLADYSAGALRASDKQAKGLADTVAGAPAGKVIYSDATADLSVAFCGLEGHKEAADLDAGLLDFNVADPARAAGGFDDQLKDLGKNRYDYRSSVVLGVTLGYRF